MRRREVSLRLGKARRLIATVRVTCVALALSSAGLLLLALLLPSEPRGLAATATLLWTALCAIGAWRMLATRKRLASSEVRTRTQQRSGQTHGRALKTIGTVGGLALMIAILGTNALHAVARLPRIGPALDEFDKAWNHAGFERLPDHLTADFRERRWHSILTALHRRNWKQQRPRLGPPRITTAGKDLARVSFKLPQGDLQTRWRWSGVRWRIERLRFPRRATPGRHG